ncbi:hypothetical protein FOL47_006332 [Perkinsus chesapeaki]|uniref:Tr-type G domain-containing protein n=1 Tax=Perkinsus chesapeaki TaxID=330153 RepID=A0A7J6LSK3_PERCH|nr:hypothetical protein FOL47_006332 [Perkinsus chesapeaki]
MSTVVPAESNSPNINEEDKNKDKKKRNHHKKKTTPTVPQVAPPPSCPAAAAAQAAVALLKQREHERRIAEEARRAAEEEIKQSKVAPVVAEPAVSGKKKKKNPKPGPLTDRDRQFREFLQQSGQVPGGNEDAQSPSRRPRTQSEMYKKKNACKSKIEEHAPQSPRASIGSSDEDEDHDSFGSPSWEMVDLPSPEGTGVVVTPIQGSTTPSPSKGVVAPSHAADGGSTEGHPSGLRAPVICVLGHSDAGKTKLLDRIRNSKVQEGEAGGISQQIGATMVPREVLTEMSQRVKKLQTEEIPGLLLLDTPGHETFNNLRHRGSSICDVGIVVVDIMHGLERQTKEAIAMLRSQRRPFVVALNKVDRLYGWQANETASVRQTLGKQSRGASDEFEMRWTKVKVGLAELGLNSALYWEPGHDERRDISVVPVSALSGDGIADLLLLLSSFSQRFLSNRLAVKSGPLVCTVLEVREAVGMGICADVILLQGSLSEGDHITVRNRSNETISSTIRALVTPKPLEELRLQGGGAAAYNYHHSVTGTAAVRISGPNLGNVETLAPEKLPVLPRIRFKLALLLQLMKEEASSTVTSPASSAGGVTLKCSSMGGLEALTKLVQDLRAPIGQSGIGDVHLFDVRKASCVLTNNGKFSVILAFDVKVNSDARVEADKLGVRIIEGDVIYKIVDELKMYLEGKEDERRKEEAALAVFPCVVSLVPSLILSRKPPFHFGLYVEEGVLRVGTPLCVASKKHTQLGKVISLKSASGDRSVDEATAGDTVVVRLSTPQNNVWFGSGGGLEEQSKIVSYITRESIDFLKTYHRDAVKLQDWDLVVRLKKLFDIT